MSKELEKLTVPVTVNKEHLLTLGDRMYVRGVELLRELVNNAYDADATAVYVTIAADKIEVEDNGCGMNEKGLRQYFNVGSPEKKIDKISPRFGRRRIGEFGIGKFAALAVADKFTVETKRGGYIFSVAFDRKSWRSDDQWQLPVQKDLASPLDLDGTRVILTAIKKPIAIDEAKNFLAESLPLRAKKFAVFVNNHKLNAAITVGTHYPVKIKTLYGDIAGDIVVAASSRAVNASGVECRVKGVLVKREFFGLDKEHSFGLSRITGWVEADFLALTSNRSDFISDDDKYKIFYRLMRQELERILVMMQKQRNERELKKAAQTLKEVLSQLRDALKNNPDLIPSGRALARARRRGALVQTAQGIKIANPDEEKPEKNGKIRQQEKEKKPDKVKEEKREITKDLVKRMRLKELGVNCALAHLGAQEHEVISDSNFIYINEDHPLYVKYSANKNEQFIYLLRLIAQEIAMMGRTQQPAKECFENQNRIIRAAVLDHSNN